MIPSNASPGASDRAATAAHIDRTQAGYDDPQSQAIEKVLDSNPTVETFGLGFVRPPVDSTNHAAAAHGLIAGGPGLERDRKTLLAIARYRVLPFRHLRELVFPNLNASVITRRMKALHAEGFVESWEERLSRGGHPRYALLSRKGLTWAMETLRAETAGQPHEQLVAFMLGPRVKTPLVLAPRTAPPFLPHQIETNRIAAALAADPALGVTWVSTWHRPFPNAVGRITLPQPDAVFVATVRGAPHLVFLEHDRGQESPASFAERKTQRYQLLLDLGVARELFGVDTFTVLVTVLDAQHRRPLERLRTLQEISAAAPMMRFTLAGWAHAFRSRAPWVAPGAPLTPAAHLPREPHTSLFSNLG
jgi:hypothetical protein